MLATLYQVLGIDTTLTFADKSGRPHAILNSGAPIPSWFRVGLVDRFPTCRV